MPLAHAVSHPVPSCLPCLNPAILRCHSQDSPHLCCLPPPTPSQACSLKMALPRQPTPMLSPMPHCLTISRWPSPVPTPPPSLVHPHSLVLSIKDATPT